MIKVPTPNQDQVLSKRWLSFILLAALLTFNSTDVFAQEFLPGCPEGLYLTDGAALKNISVRISLTADNSFALYTGNQLSSSQFIGNGELSQVSTFNFNIPNYMYLYVVTQSDLSGAQGLISQFWNLDQNIQILMQNQEWEVSGTGRYGKAPYSNSASAFAELNSQITASNQGTTPSHGWVQPTAGPYNGGGVWGRYIYLFDPQNRWVWYSSNGDPDPTSPGFNHQEYLIFRIRIEATLPKACVLCTLEYYCPQNSVEPTQCPDDTATKIIGASSPNECLPLPNQIYQNLAFPVLADSSNLMKVYKVATNITDQSTIVYKLQCDPTYQSRMGKPCEATTKAKLNIFWDGCSSGGPKNANYDTSPNKVGKFSFSFQNCYEISITSELSFEILYSKLGDESIQESCVMASSLAEVHQRFTLIKTGLPVRNCLSFGRSSIGVELNFTPQNLSKQGLAEGDTFNGTNIFTKILATAYNDILFVNSFPNNNEIPSFFMGEGNDIILCASDCIVYGEAGKDTFSVTSGILDIRDFNPAEDVINLKPYQSNIKIPEHINYTTEDNGMTFVLAVSNEATIRVHMTTKVDYVENLTIIYDAPSCYRMCNQCVNETQCELCSSCKECNGVNCTACNSSTFLQEGKCIADCTTNYLRHPDTSINHCILCTQANCLGCPTVNNCSQCSANFIPQFGVCNTCLNIKGYYSNDRDKTCSKCGAGCDFCNETNCFNCAPEYLYAPKLSIQFCFIKLSAYFGDINPDNSVASTNSQQKVLSSFALNSDGTVSKIDSSVKTSSGNSFVSSLQLQTSFIDENANQIPFDQTIASRRILGGQEFLLGWESNQRVLGTTNASYATYRQFDEKWSVQVMGKSIKSLKSKGCVVTCVAMILAGIGKQIKGELVNPSNLNKWLSSNEGYQLGTINFVWAKMSNFGLTYVGNFTEVDELIAQYKNGNAVILAVKQGIHKVLMTGLDKSGNTLYVKDPGYFINSYDKTEVRFGYVYKMPLNSSVQPQKTAAIYATDIQSFERFAFGFQSCYQHTQSFSDALFSKDQNKLIKLSLETPIGMERVKIFNEIVQNSFVQKPQLCLQSNNVWSNDGHDIFGISKDLTGKYDTLSYSQYGSQMCSLTMVLSSLGIMDPISKMYYSPDRINLLLVQNNALKKSEFKLTLNGSQKFFIAKNMVDWASLVQLQLFGLTSITELKSSQNGLSLTSDQFTTLKQLIRGQKNRVILEVKSIYAGETYYVYAANKFQGNSIQVIDPVNGQTRFAQMQDIVNYVKISVKNIYQSFEIDELYNLLAGNPYYHAIFRYKSNDGSHDKIKSYYLMNWTRTDNTPILKETFAMQDLNSDSITYKQNINLLAIQDIDGSPFIISQAEVFVNKKYVVDKSSYVSNQACTRNEIQNYIGLNQQRYNNAINQISYCYDNQITLASDLIANCPPNSENVLTCSQFFCASQFKSRIDPIEGIMNTQADIPKGDSRYCSLMKLSYQFNGFQQFSTNSKLMSSIKYKQYSSAAFALINTKYACLAQPNQLMEVFLGMQSGLSPALAKPLTVSEPVVNSLVYGGSDRAKVCESIKKNALSGSSGFCARYVRRAILLARGEADSGGPNAYLMGPYITERGWRRSNIDNSQAQIGDIVIFQETKDHPNGHIAVKCDDGWYSDWHQKGFYINRDGSKPPFVIYN